MADTAPSGAAGLPESAEPRAVEDWIDAWVRTPELGQLAEASGWSPATGPADLDVLARHSVDWDFRSGAERHLLTERPATVNGRSVDEALVRRAARALGLIGGMPVTGTFTHTVVLGGMAMACLNRLRFAAGLAGQAELGALTMLTAHRPLQGKEHDQVTDAGWGPLTLESEAAMAAVRDAWRLSAPSAHDHGTAAADRPPDVPEDEFRQRVRWDEWRWTDRMGVAVVAVASSDPARRRANTADQLAFWAARADVGSADRVLLVTTDHYVPYQHLAALRALGLSRRCRIVTTGVPWKPSGPYRGAAYLQEIRSALLAAVELQAALPAAARPPRQSSGDTWGTR